MNSLDEKIPTYFSLFLWANTAILILTYHLIYKAKKKTIKALLSFSKTLKAQNLNYSIQQERIWLENIWNWFNVNGNPLFTNSSSSLNYGRSQSLNVKSMFAIATLSKVSHQICHYSQFTSHLTLHRMITNDSLHWQWHWQHWLICRCS